ncbi:MAG: S41 family peptidase [Candidatus Latescibacterota bacterium]|nr:MAG: S41 family peptidase [Candidatus Latescibacterota bacterium]
MRSKRALLGILLVVLLVFGPSAYGRSASDLALKLRVLNEVLLLVREKYVEEVSPSELMEGAIEGLLEKLDPHSEYQSPEERARMTERLRGDYEGIGIAFEIRKGILTVISPIEGGPSYKLGIKAGDQIVKIDGKSAIGIKEREVFERLRGPKGTKVHVSIRRAGVDSLLEFTIVRDRIPIRSVPYAYMLRQGVGYVRITRFGSRTGEELEAALDSLEAKGMRKLLLDLRANAGGLLTAAIEVAEKFLPKGYVVTYTKGRDPEVNEQYVAEAELDELHPYYPIIVLINHGSASASEIVSGALQDWDRALIVGQRSFGKGLVQHQFPLSDGGALLLTVARYYTPSGRLIQRPYAEESRLAYFREAFQREEEPDTARPAFFTKHLRRKVYGGGGIWPDFVLKPEYLDTLETKLYLERMFLDFAEHYVGEHGEFPGTLEDFLKGYEISDEVLMEFLSFAEGQGVPIPEDALEAYRDFLGTQIKAALAGRIWGDYARYRVALEGDREVWRAVEHFDEAEALLREAGYLGGRG